MANLMIEPRSIQSQRFHILAPLTNRPQQHMRLHDKNQLLQSCIKFRYQKFLPRLPRHAAPPRMHVHNFIYRLIMSQI